MPSASGSFESDIYHRHLYFQPLAGVGVAAGPSWEMPGGGIQQNAAEWRLLYKSRAKLKAASNTSALLAGFAMVALVELDITSAGHEVSEPLLIVYGVCTTLLVSVHLLALMMSTCILPEMEAVTNLHTFNAPGTNNLPHRTLKPYIVTAWFFSTCLGLLLFLAEVGIIFWVKFFHFSKLTSYVTTALLCPVFIMLIVFTVKFYQKLTDDQMLVAARTVTDLEAFLKNNNDSMIDPLNVGLSSPVILRPPCSFRMSTGSYSSANDVEIPLDSWTK